MKAKLAIQCLTSTGETGDFLYAFDDPGVNKTPISPVFPDLVKFYDWAHANGWTCARSWDVSCVVYEQEEKGSEDAFTQGDV